MTFVRTMRLTAFALLAVGMSTVHATEAYLFSPCQNPSISSKIIAPQAPLEESATTEASRRCSLTGILAGFKDGFGDGFLTHLRAVSAF